MQPNTVNKNISTLPTVTPQEQANIDVFNQGLKTQGVNSEFIAGKGVINSDVLKNNQPKLKLPEPTTSTVATGIIGATEANLQQAKDSVAKQQELDLINAKNTASASKADYGSVVDQIMGVQNNRSTLETNANIPKLSQEATDITNQIETTQRAYQNELKALDSAGLTDAGRASASRDISRKYASTLADLSIIQDVKNRNLTTAQTNIDRKIQLQLEPLKIKADYLKTIYEDNKDNLTKSEDRAFQTKIKEEDRNYKKEEDRIKTLEDTKLEILKLASEQGAPLNVLSEIQKATTPEEVYIKAGEFSGNIVERQIKQATLRKLQIDAKKAMEELGEAKQGPLAKAQAQNNINLISGLASDKYLDSAVGPNVLVRTSYIKNAFTGGKNNFIAGVEQLRSQLTLDSLVNAKARGATFGALSEGELKTLQASGSKLATWALKDKDGNITGYNASEVDFKRELDKINNFAKLDFLIKGGSPEDVGAKKMDDGTVWVLNSDGTYTQLN